MSVERNPFIRSTLEAMWRNLEDQPTIRMIDSDGDVICQCRRVELQDYVATTFLGGVRCFGLRTYHELNSICVQNGLTCVIVFPPGDFEP